jgi:hypothetical protein
VAVGVSPYPAQVDDEVALACQQTSLEAASSSNTFFAKHWVAVCTILVVRVNQVENSSVSPQYNRNRICHETVRDILDDLNKKVATMDEFMF